ncbi:MAG: DUF1937 family protein [Nitrospiraceae bacterium]
MIIYIASPYSVYTDKLDAVNAQIDVFAALLAAGHEPVAPLLSHYVDLRYPTSYERWMQWCLAIMRRCDAVLRLPGESAGADEEVARARLLGKPVYWSVDEAIRLGDQRTLKRMTLIYRVESEEKVSIELG